MDISHARELAEKIFTQVKIVREKLHWGIYREEEDDALEDVFGNGMCYLALVMRRSEDPELISHDRYLEFAEHRTVESLFPQRTRNAKITISLFMSEYGASEAITNELDRLLAQVRVSLRIVESLTTLTHSIHRRLASIHFQGGLAQSLERIQHPDRDNRSVFSIRTAFRKEVVRIDGMSFLAAFCPDLYEELERAVETQDAA